MKKIMYLFLGLMITALGCQTDSKFSESEKEALVQAVMKTSQQFWSMAQQPYDTGSFRAFLKYWDENSDQIWQTDPATVVFNTSITKTGEEWMNSLKGMINNRIRTFPTILESHFSALSNDKVLEVHKGDYTITMKDSTVSEPFTMVNTIVWANINGDWKMQFWHESWAKKSE